MLETLFKTDQKLKRFGLAGFTSRLIAIWRIGWPKGIPETRS